MNEFIKQRMARLASRVHELEAQGADREALKVREDLCDLTREHPEEGQPHLIHRLLDLAASYRQMGDTEHAEKTYLEVIQYLEQHPTSASARLPQILNTVGVYYCEREQHKQAVALFRRALSLSQDEPSEAKLATLHNNLASSYHSLGQAVPAREHYHEALRLFDHHPLSAERAHCLCDLAELLAEEEDENAKGQIVEALHIFRQLYPTKSLLLAEAHLRIADLYCRMADTRSAMSVLEEAAGMLEHSSQSEQERAQCLDLLSRLQVAAGLCSNYPKPRSR